MEKRKKYANLFGNNPDISINERVRVVTELNKIGDLTFNITANEDGWLAQCAEVSGIIAGSTNPNPTSSEIESQIRDSIYAAFSVKIKTGDNASPYFSYNSVSKTNFSKSTSNEPPRGKPTGYRQHSLRSYRYAAKPRGVHRLTPRLGKVK